MRCLLATALNRQHMFEKAELELRGVIERHPEIPKAHLELGHALFGQGRGLDAVACFEKVVQLTPDKSVAHLDLSVALSKVGKEGAARQALEQSFRLDPGRKDLLMGAEHQRAGRFEDAERVYRGVIAREPTNVTAVRLLGSLASETRRHGIAVRQLRKAVEMKPDYFSAWVDLGRELSEQEQFEECEEALRHAIRLEPKLPHPRTLLGSMLAKAGRYDEAIAAYEVALEMQPDHSGSLAGMGHLLRTIGRTDEAIAAYRQCIKNHPAFGEAYWSLANLKTFRFTDEELATMEENVDNDRLLEETKVCFNFALGKAYEDRGEYDRAFSYIDRGNAMRRVNENYDPVQTEVIHDRIIDTFCAEFMTEKGGHGDPDPSPIFIVGLPRSGSTLIEQILASHSQVEGTHELADLPRVIRSINQENPGGKLYPEAFQQFDAEKFRVLGKQYLDATQRHRSGAPRFTDKMPNNFPSVGMIQLLLPNAKIVNARRHPLDSCMGSYKQLFFKGQAFSYDLVEIGEYYIEYQRLMDYWHDILPGRVLDVQYEQMVGDQENQTRRLLEYCELPWEDNCLRFYENKRAVNTASSEQVRQPIYSKSLNSWRRYEVGLAPLIEVLEPLLLNLPVEDRPSSLH
jgi:tetratricopeptide (TPR) repeat protein